MSDILFDIAWRSIACAAIALMALRCLRGRSAAVQSAVAHAGIVATLLLPASMHVLRPMAVGLLDFPTTISTHVEFPSGVSVATARRSDTLVMARLQESPIDWIAAAYFIVAGLLLTRLLASLMALDRERRHAVPVLDHHWTAVFDGQRGGEPSLRRVALLISDRVAAPVSWGWPMPVIVIDPRTARDPAQIDPVLCHELAHIRHHDWAKLILVRFVTALFWFNPLIWRLARHCHELRERCADDAVLSRLSVSPATYARLLVDTSLRARHDTLTMSHAMAHGAGELAKRVDSILDGTRARSPETPWATLAACAALVLMSAPIAVVGAASPSAATLVASGRTAELAAAQLSRLDSPRAQALAHTLTTQDWDARPSKGVTLANDSALINPLLLALDDERAGARRIALWGLSEVRPHAGASATASIAELLRDETPGIRGDAARALADHGQASYAQQIASLLADPEPVVREQAVHALVDLGEARMRSRVADLQTDVNPAVRAKARWAVEQFDEMDVRRVQ